ncbi:unnamed protein product [Brugia timori]|uniref:Uncharacterized protein n=1 Tax=Brugia timori TaxID=42155 RepID=A0A0R3QXR3_9BILA|nr:unnamed protein product [Brugia timori]
MLNIVNVPNLKILCSQVSGESSLSSPPPPATPPPPPGIPYSVAVGLGTKNTKGSILQTRFFFLKSIFHLSLKIPEHFCYEY